MITRRGFIKMAACAAIGLFAGNVAVTTVEEQPTEFFAGEIGNVQIFDRALTPAEVAQHYVQGKPNPLTKGLVGFWSGAQMVCTTTSSAYWNMLAQADDTLRNYRREDLYGPPRKCWPMIERS